MTTAPPAPAVPGSADSAPASWLPLAAIATTLLLWSSAFVAIRHLGHEVSPAALTLARLVVGGVVLTVLVLRSPRHRMSRRELGLLLLCGVAWFGVYNLALNASEQSIDAATAAMLVQVGPIIVALLAAAFLRERLTAWVVVGMAVAFAGVTVIGSATRGDDGADLRGVLLAIVAAVGFAIGVVCQKVLLRTLSAVEVTCYSCWIGAAVCLPWVGDLADVVRAGHVSTLLQLGYLGLFPTAIAFSTWAFALRHTDAGKQAITTFLVPALTTVLAWLLLDEVPPALAFLGGALCIGGVLLTRRKPRALPAPDPATV